MSDGKCIPCGDETYVPKPTPPGWNLLITVSGEHMRRPFVKEVGYWGDPMGAAQKIIREGYTHTIEPGIYTLYPPHRIDEVLVRRQPEDVI